MQPMQLHWAPCLWGPKLFIFARYSLRSGFQYNQLMNLIVTPESHSISKPFRSEEFAAVLRRAKSGKSQGMDSIFPEFIVHAGSALKSWFCDFLNS